MPPGSFGHDFGFWKIDYLFTYQNDYLQYFPAAVVISFFVCWTPFHTQRLGYVFFAHLQNDAGYIFRTINEFLYSISGICYYASSTMNPILYNMMSSRYRQAFKNTLCGLTGSKYLLFIEIWMAISAMTLIIKCSYFLPWKVF